MREYLNVGQMSALFHLNKQTLQYYDREKIFSPAYRNPENNYRMYRFDQVYGLALSAKTGLFHRPGQEVSRSAQPQQCNPGAEKAVGAPTAAMPENAGHG